MKSLIIVILCFFGYLTSYGQLDEDFIDQEIFTNPTWLGDVSDFKVVDGILHLDAEDGGESILFTSIDFPDSILWDFVINLDFSPSGSNKLTIFLASKIGDNADNAYYLEVGETGSKDAFSFYRAIDGNKELLGRATDGSLGSAPAIANVIVKFDADHFWTISVDYNTGVVQEEMVVLDDTFIPSDYLYFGIDCKYTSSRKDKYQFDHFKIDTLLPDLIGPELFATEVTSEYQLKLLFSEPLTEESVNNKSNYVVDPDLAINAILWNESLPKEFYLIFDEKMKSGVKYDLTINNISDELDNISDPIHTSFSLVENAVHGDLVVNEVLFNPVPGGNDFVEIYNNSAKTITLDSLVLYNAQNGQATLLNIPNGVIFSGDFLALTSKKSNLISMFPKNNPSAIVEHKIPSMNNDFGNISIYKQIVNGFIMIDSFTYFEGYHSPYLTDIEGVSLERIDPSRSTSDVDNWHSATENFNFGSPGIKNSVALPEFSVIEDMFFLVTKSFSPDGDGFDDLMLLQFNIEKNDLIFDIDIYDSKGVHIKNLVSNSSFSSEGVLTWDGIDKNGQLSQVGIYIININAINIDQEHHNTKMTVVLARHL